MDSETQDEGGYKNANSIYNTLYLFLVFTLPFLGYISSIIYKPEVGITWYKGLKFLLLDISNNSYGLFFTLFIYLFVGMGIVYISDYYIGNDDLSDIPTSRLFSRIKDPLSNLSRFWDSIVLTLLPVGLFLLWVSQPLMLQFQSLVIPGSLTVISSALFLFFAIYMIKVHWLIMIFFLPLCIWCIYLSAFYFLPEKDSAEHEAAAMVIEPEVREP